MGHIKGTKVGDIRRIGCQLRLTEKQFILLCEKDVVLSSLMNELLSMYLDGMIEVPSYKLGRRTRSDDGTARRLNGRPVIPYSQTKETSPEDQVDILSIIKKHKSFERAVRSIVQDEIYKLLGGK